MQIWPAMFAAAFVPCGLLTLSRQGVLPTSVYFALYAAVQVAMFTIPPYLARAYNLPIASSMVVLCEQVRLSMKMHSFVRETYRQAKRTDTLSEEEQLRALLEEPNTVLLPTAQQRLASYFFFLFCPTLVFQNRYPRTAKIRWTFVFSRFGETLACVYYTYATGLCVLVRVVCV